MRIIKDFVRSRPPLYDRMRSLKRSLTGSAPESFRVLSEFSRARGGRVNFIQIGANDGLRNDPLRPLVIRDDWKGVLIEPLPSVFLLLQNNYRYLMRDGLVFLNAAVTAEGGETMQFWTFAEDFLAAQPLEARLDFLRKASFQREHVAGFLPEGADPDRVLVGTDVPCLSLPQVVAEHLPRRPLDLLVIDAEGYEATLIPAIDFGTVECGAVFFESEHLDEAARKRVMDHLTRHGFTLRQVGLDSLAERSIA